MMTMETNRPTSIRLVRNQSVNLTTMVVTEGDTTDCNWTVTEGIRARKSAWLNSLLAKNDLQGLAYAIRASR